MARITALLLTVGSAFSVVSATTVHVNKGCIIVNDSGICAGKSTAFTSGYTEVKACVSRESDGQFANCAFEGEVPTNWDDAFWGENNCLYSAGKSPILVGCSHPISKMPIPNIY